MSATVGTKYIRMNGKAEFMGEDAKTKALEIMPALAQMIQPGNFEIFAITNGEAIISDLLSADIEKVQF